MQIKLPQVAIIVVLGLIVSGLSMPEAIAKDKRLDLSTAKAPVAPDGTTAGAPTDFVITFKDLDPARNGEKLRTGDTIEFVLSDAFTNTGAGGNNVILLQGWPQSPPAPPPLFPWTVAIDGNTVTVTMTGDFKPGESGPGPKQAHMLLLGFSNPVFPGVYPVEMTITRNAAKKSKKSKGRVQSGVAQVRILPDARPSVEPISLFSGPPGPPPPFFNPLYQTLSLGEPARRVGVYLWDAGSVPFVGVDVAATGDPSYYELRQGAVVVGDVYITAPAGANAYSLASVGLPPGGPPSVAVPAFVTGLMTGLLGIQFTPDPAVAGDYEISIGMHGGNEKTLFVSVRD